MPVTHLQACPQCHAVRQGQVDNWILEFEAAAPRTADPLMGWTSSGDTRQQVRLRLRHQEEAIAYAEREGLAYHVIAGGSGGRPIKKSYSDNFKWGRSDNWTH